MSNFEMPPLIGFDPRRATQLRIQDPERTVREREGVPPGGDLSTAFGNFLESAVGRINDMQKDVNTKVQDMARGGDTDLADVMAASGKSEVAFNLLLEVRNKLVDAWEKLSRSAV